MEISNMRLTLAQATPGMILADDILDSGGNLLLKGGTSLSESMLTSLQRYQLGSFTVIGEESDAVDDSVARERVQTRLAHLFRHCADDNPSRTLRAWIGEYCAGEGS
jgi:hypothetical protein